MLAVTPRDARGGSSSRASRAHIRWAGLPVAVLIAAFNLTQLANGAFAARLYDLAFLLVVPGTAVVSLTRARPREVSVRIAWSVGASILLLMFLGLVESIVLPHLGIARPLSSWPLVVGVDVVTIASLAAHGARHDPLDFILLGRVPRSAEIAFAVVLALLPVAAMAGAERLNNGESGVLSIVVLVAAGVLLLATFLRGPHAPRWTIGSTLYSVTTAVLLMSSMRSNYPFGYDIQSEFQVFTATLHSGAWHVPSDGNAYASMLSITVLPAVLTVISHVSGIVIFKVVYPLVFGLFPVLVFIVSSRWFGVRASLVGAMVVIVQGLFAADITGLARQEIGLVYFALMVVTGFDEALPRRVRQAAVVVAGIAMAISHYSTAYFAALLFMIGYVVYAILRVARRKHGPPAVFTLPVLILMVGAVSVWNVSITRSAQNVGNLVSSIDSGGLQILSGSPGTSVIQRFLNADVSPTVSVATFSAVAANYYQHHASYLHPYPAALTKKYPIEPASVKGPPARAPASLGRVLSTSTTIANELLLLLTAIGVIAFLWRERRGERPERAELAAFALACVALLGVLRLSSTVSSLYNAPRGQVQGSPLLSVALALVCSWLFTRRKVISGAFVALTAAGLALLIFSDSGATDLVFGGGGPATLVNYGEAYQRYYFTDADIASAKWLVQRDSKGEVVYADIYGGLQIYETAHIRGLVTTMIPQVMEPGAWVYATSTNVVHGTARSLVENDFAVFRFPDPFLEQVKNIVFSTGTTEVFR
ncbi:MAG: hypothetical protein JWO62_3127 [Acidimicrobiaceae bacterium]|nr:hypothetical protein [Acidimicrobiaceae bacterium]